MSRRAMIYDPELMGLESVMWSSNSDQILARCPFHLDTHPSFSFNIETGLFFCFSCGESGNVEKLAKHLGVSLSIWPEAEVRAKIKKHVSSTPFLEGEMLRNLLSFPLAFNNEYLKSRGITDETVQHFSIRESKNTVIFPIFSFMKPAPVGVQVRYTEFLRDGTRYMTFGHRTVMTNGFGPLFDSLMKNYVAVEGIFGLLKAHQNKVPAFCTFGASFSSSFHGMKQMLSMAASITAAYDNDQAGLTAAAKMLVGHHNARAIIPGVESDEIPSETWEAIRKGEIYTTSDYQKVIELAVQKGGNRIAITRSVKDFKSGITK